MRQLKIIGVAVIAILALTAITAATASAALPEFLDGTVKGLKFTVKSGAGELISGFAIGCTSDKGSGEVTGAKTVSVTVTFEGCTVFFQAANSLGAAAKTIVVPATGELCFIKSGSPLEVGLKLKPTAGVHIEVPSVGELDVVTGTVVGKVEPINVLQTTGKVTLKKGPFQCEGAKSELLSEKQENKKPEKAEEVTTEEVTYEKDIEVMG